MSIFLLISFLVNALISSLIGLGGGTFYLLFLSLFSVNHEIIPFIALLCNITVSGTSAGIQLLRGQREHLSFLISLLIPSMISTYIGGQFVINARNFRLILSSVILLILCFLLLIKKTTASPSIKLQQNNKILVVSLISFGIGFLSGMIGIGGGIILGPVLHMLGMSYLDIPLITAIYIFVNSIIGIISHTIKYTNSGMYTTSTLALEYLGKQLIPYLPLILVCLCSAIFSIYFKKKLKNESTIKNILFVIMLSLTIYNLIQTGIYYYG